MKIFYTGIGCKKEFIHTESEFLKIMEKEITNRRHVSEFKGFFEGHVLPDDFIFFNLKNWLDFSGAEILSE